MRRRPALLAVLILAAAGSARAEPPAPLADGVLSLAEAWQLVQDHSYSLAAARQRSQAARDLQRAASADFLPGLDVSASYSRLSEVESLPIDLGESDPVSFPQSESSINLGLAVEQPVFVPALAAAARRSRHLAAAARQMEKLGLADVRVALEETYTGELAARAMAAATEDALLSVRAHLRQVKLMEEVGLATRLDAALVEARLAELEVTEVQVSSAVQLARLVLVTLAGLPADAAFDLEPPAPPPAEPPPAGEELVARALENRPDILAFEASVRAARAQAGIVSAGLWPNVAFRFGYQYDKPNQRAFPPPDKFVDSWDASIGLGWRLWDFGASFARARAARGEADAAGLELEAARDGVRLDVYQKWVAMNEAQARLGAARRAELAGAEALRVARDRYQVGDAANTDVLDAQMTFTQARFRVIQAESDCRLAWTRLQRAIGAEP